MQITPIKTEVFKENENLFKFILQYLKKIPENSIIVVTSKIIALSEGRTVAYENEKQKIELIKEESEFALKTKHTWLTIKDGMILANSGIDESNANGKIILLPRDSFNSAEELRKKIMHKFGLKNFGVLITDSRLFPLRAGVVGIATGYSGFKGIRNYIGKKDIFGRLLKMSKTDVADSLATSATLCMGEGKERQPVALITEAPVVFSKKINRQELRIDPNADMFYPLLRNINAKKK